MAQPGQVVEVLVVGQGSQVKGDHTAGDTSVLVEDATPFQEVDSQIRIDGDLYDCTAVDEVTDADATDESNGLLTIDPGLLDDVPDGTLVDLPLGDQRLDDVVLVVDTGDEAVPIFVTVTADQRDHWSALEGPVEPAIPVLLSDDLTEVLDAPGVTLPLDLRNADPGYIPPPADGVVPGIPQDVATIAARGLVFVRWSPVLLNADGDTQEDATRYRVYVGAAGETTVAQDDAHRLVDNWSGTMIAATTTADGTPLAYEDADGNVLEYPFAVAAVDNDGEGALSAVVLGHMDKTGAADLVVGDVLAAVIEAITVSGQVLTTRAKDPDTGALLGPGWTIDATSIIEYDQAGDAQTELKLGTSTFRGNAALDFLTVLGSATFDADVTLSPGSTFRLGGGAAGVADPIDPPTYSIGYTTQQFDNDHNWTDRRGWSTDGAYWYTARETSRGFRIERWDPTGALSDYNVADGAGLTLHGSVVAGTHVYILYYYFGWVINEYRLSDLVKTADVAVTGTTAQLPDGTSKGVALGYDSASSEFLIAQSRATNSDKVRIRRFSWNGVATSVTWSATAAVDTTYGYPYDLMHVLYGSFDLGASRYVFGRGGTGSEAFQVVNTSGTLQTGEQWNAGLPVGVRGMTWASRTVVGTRTSGSPTLTLISTPWAYAVGQSISGTGIPGGATITALTATTITMSANASSSAAGATFTVGPNFITVGAAGLMQTYEAGAGNRWTSSADATWYAAYAWTDGADHTATSNYVTIPMLKRARLTITTPEEPAGITGTTVYLAKGSTPPDVTTASMTDNGDAT